MKRQLLLLCSCLLLIAGWLSAFLMRAIPQPSDYYYLAPALLLGIGLGLLLKLMSAMRTAIVVALMAIISILAVNQLYPDGKIGLSRLLPSSSQATVSGQAIPLEVREQDKVGIFATPRTLYSPAALRVQLFARLPGGARMLAFDNAGGLYVSIPQLGAIYQLRDDNNDGFAEQPVLYHVGMDRPHGLAWHDQKLYVAETTRLLRLEDTDNDNQVDDVVELITGLPDDGGHWTRSLAGTEDGNLYLSIGSRCNVCEENDPRRATVLLVNPKSGKSRIFASGLRNTVGLTIDETTNILWGSDNGRDMLGDDLPPDEINRLIEGGNYGWPYCYGAGIPDPDLGRGELCEDTLPAALELPAHSAPLGIDFGRQLQASQTFRDSMYVAFHGSWNRSVPTGYKLVRIPFAAGEPTAIEDFLSGWLVDGKAWGRPVAPLSGPDGSLYLTDDRANAVYRISWQKQE